MGFLDRLHRLLSPAPDATLAGGPPDAAVDANERGLRASEAGDRAGAIRAYEEAARLAPRWPIPWFNLGLEHKRDRRWRASLEANARALALERNPSKSPAAWNLGIAATALGEWREARRAWRAFGIEVPDGEGPPALDLGLVPIRIGGEDASEVVWGTRLDPARARIVTVPFRESGRCRGDVVLHDGAPNGWRKLGDREVAVFDELELLVPSRESTWVVEATVPGPEDAAALGDAFERRGVAFEDWTLHVRILCKACSEGRPDAAPEAHDERCGRRHGGEPPWSREHRFGVASEAEAPVLAALGEWVAGGEGRAHGEVELALVAEGRPG